MSLLSHQQLGLTEMGPEADRAPGVRGFEDNSKDDCTARQCSPVGRKFMECYIINPAQSLLMKHLVIGQR